MKLLMMAAVCRRLRWVHARQDRCFGLIEDNFAAVACAVVLMHSMGLGRCRSLIETSHLSDKKREGHGSGGD
jgi:hypothetical protein